MHIKIEHLGILR